MCHAMLLHMAGARVLVNDIQEERLAYCKSIFPFIDTYTGGELPEYVRNWTGGRGLDVAVVACPAPQAQAMMPELMNIGGRINFFLGGFRRKRSLYLLIQIRYIIRNYT